MTFCLPFLCFESNETPIKRQRNSKEEANQPPSNPKGIAEKHQRNSRETAEKQQRNSREIADKHQRNSRQMANKLQALTLAPQRATLLQKTDPIAIAAIKGS